MFLTHFQWNHDISCLSVSAPSIHGSRCISGIHIRGWHFSYQRHSSPTFWVGNGWHATIPSTHRVFFLISFCRLRTFPQVVSILGQIDSPCLNVGEETWLRQFSVCKNLLAWFLVANPTYGHKKQDTRKAQSASFVQNSAAPHARSRYSMRIWEFNLTESELETRFPFSRDMNSHVRVMSWQSIRRTGWVENLSNT